MINRIPYGEEYLDWYYNKGGMRATLLGEDSVYAKNDQIRKAVGPWDAPASPYTIYFEPVFSMQTHIWTTRNSEVYKLVPKTTFIAEGDSLKYISTDLAGLYGIATVATTPFASGSAEAAPTIASLEEIKPAFVIDPWELSMLSKTYATWQKEPKYDPVWIKNYHAELLPHQLDKMLCRVVDTPSNDASTFDLESIDRICSDDNEASTTYVSNAADPDLWYGAASVMIDRSADTGNVFGCGGGAGGTGLSLPATAAARVLSLDLIDDVMAESSRYSKNKRYIGLTGPKTINEMQKLIDPKQRYLEGPGDVEITMNGVSTRPGKDAGFSVATFTSNGIRIPIFSSSQVANETSSNRSATITDADIGNIYFLDLDGLELREGFPITYMETPPEAMLTLDLMKSRHAFLYSAQLLCTNFRSQGAVKYLKST